jgi:hypothetical protein
VHAADTPPADPVINQIWWDSSSGNSFVYYNDGNSTQWVPLTLGSIGGGGGGGGVPEAPIDGKQYGRQDADWTEITGGGGGGDVYLAADNEFTGEVNHFRDINIRPFEDGALNSGSIAFSTSVATWGDLGYITHDGTLLRLNNLKEGQSGVLLATNEVSLTVGGSTANLDLKVLQDASEANFWFSSYTPDGFVRPMGAINAVKKQVWTSTPTTQDADLVFYVGENGSLIERAKVTNRGVETAWEAYGPSWNGNYSVPTKDAVYDKIETMAGGGGLPASTMAEFDTACTDGDFVFQSQPASVTTLTATGAVVLDDTLTTTHTSSFATGATASGQTKTINFGTGGVAG